MVRSLRSLLFIGLSTLFSLNVWAQCNSTVTVFPWDDSFEGGFTNWTGDIANPGWQTTDAGGANGTPSFGTGPTTIVDGSLAAYTEVSGAGSPNVTMDLNGPCFALPHNSIPFFSFVYHMYNTTQNANAMGSLALQVNDDPLNSTVWTTVWSDTGNQGNVWIPDTVDLSTYAGDTIQIRFRSISGTGDSTWQGDRAIDRLFLSLGVNVNHNYCIGGTSGSASVNAQYGTIPYTYLWSTGATTQSISGLAAGNYTVTVVDALLDTAIVPFTILPGTVPSISTLPYFESWEDSLGDWTNLTTDDFDWSFRSNGIGGTGPTVPDFPSDGSIYIYTEASGQATGNEAILSSPCFNFGANTLPYFIFDYQMKVDGGGGSAANMGWLYLIADTTPTTTNTGDTVWSQFGDAGNNWITDTVDLSMYAGSEVVLRFTGEIGTGIPQYGDRALDNLRILDAVETSESCDGGSGGSIFIDPQHGTAPYTYLWNTNATTQGISNLGAGTYTVTITDANTNTLVRSVDIDTLEIPAPTGLTADITSFCANDQDTAMLSIDYLAGDATFFGSSDTLNDLGPQNTAGESVLYSLIGAPNTATSDATFAFYSRGDLEAPGEYINCFSESGNLLAQALNHSAQCAGFYEVVGFEVPVDTINTWTQDDTIFMEGDPFGMTRYCGFGGTRYSQEGYFTVSYKYSTLQPYWFENSCDTVIANAVDSGFFISVAPTTTTTYYVRFYNAECQAWGDCDSITITVNAPPVVTADPNPASYCNQLPTTITASGASSYSWSPGTGLNIDTGAVVTTTSNNPITYTLTGTDGNGCSDTTLVNLQITSPPTVGFTNTNVTCNSGMDGQIATVTTGGTAPYSYQWSNGGTNSSIGSLSAGTYTVTVTDSLGCASSNTTLITEPGPVNVFAFANPVTCNGLSSGSFFANATGGTQPYDFNWSSGQSTLNTTFSFVGGQTAGTYTVTVTDQLGCSGTDSVEVVEPDPLSIDSVNVVDVLCNGGNDGTAEAFVSGGTSPYNYTWNPGNLFGANVNGLSAGTYTLNVTDNNGCFETTTLVVAEPTPVVASASVDNPVTCFGGNDGSATASGSGGTPGYTYLWDNNETTATAVSLTAGLHCVTVTDTNGCTDTACVTITEPDTVSAGIVITNVSCYDGNNGALASTPSGGNGAPYTYLWSTGATSSSISGLVADSYTLTVTDNSGCSNVFTSTVTQPDSLDLAMSSTNALCNGETTGTAAVVVTGGTSPYTYIWSNGQTADNATGLGAGTHTVTVTDANGCGKTGSVTITEPAMLVVNIDSSNDVSCFGFTDGEAFASATGGTSPYSFAWTSGSTNDSAGGLAAGTYTVVVTDANACTASNSVVITQPAVLALATQVNANVTCNGGMDGEGEVVATGGTMPYDYLWSNGSTSNTAPGLVAGTHTVTVTDANGCVDTETVTITEPTPIVITLNVDSMPSCAGDNDGGVSGGATGGTGALSFLWNTGSSSTTLSGVPAATYTVTVTDISGCTEVDSIVLNEPDPLVATFSSIDSISCNGVSDGGLFADGIGGTGPYTFLWSTGTTADSITGLTDGTFTVTVTDANGCVDDTSTTLISPAIVILSLDSTNDVNCFGGSDGEAHASGTGGTLPYTFAWSNGSFGSSINDLTQGSHSVTLTDVNGCADTDNFSISQPASALSVSAMVDSNASCNGFSDGGASVSASGGTAPYTYNWTSGSNTTVAAGLSAGTHTVVVTDANGCQDSASVTITEPTAVVASIGIDSNVSCNGGNDGALTASATGGAAGYSYLWSTGATSASISGLVADSYTVTITDASGCTGTQSETITEPTALTVSITVDSNASCNGGSNGGLTASGSGGTTTYSYQWSNGSSGASINGLSATTYTVTITDANGCTSTASEIITEPTPVVVVIDSSFNADCFGASTGSAFASASGGNGSYTFAWSNSGSGNSISGLAAGTYTVTATDANGCQGTNQVIITEPASALNLVTAVDSNVSCQGDMDGGVSVVASGGTSPYTYLWSNGSIQDFAAGLAAGTHTVTVTDANGCSETATETVTQPNLLVATTTIDSNVACNGGGSGGMTAGVTGGTSPYTYSWSNGDMTQSITGLTAGPYTVTVSDANGCFTTASGTITEPTDITSNTFTLTDVTCFMGSDGTAQVTANGGTTPYTYLWSNGDTSDIADSLAAGTFTVTITDANGCTETNTATITQPSNIGVELVSVPASGQLCFGDSSGSFLVTEIGGSGNSAPGTYLWSTGSTDSVITGLPAGAYSVIFTSTLGCQNTLTGSLTQPDSAIESTITALDTLLCNGASDASLLASATGGYSSQGYSFMWSNGSTIDTAMNLSAGTYFVTISDSLNCQIVDSFTVTEPSAVQASITSTVDASCFGEADGEATAGGSGGTGAYTFLWQDGQTNATAMGLAAGTYTVIVTDANGCSDTTSATISEPTLLVAAVALDSNASCNGFADGGATASASGGTAPYTYLWSDGQTDASAVNLAAGTYIVTVTDFNGCEDTISINITEPMPLVASTVVDSNAACNGSADGGATASATGGTSPYAYLWSNGQIDSNATNLAAGVHTVTITDANGCVDVTTVTITEPSAVLAAIALDSNVSCNGFADGGATASASGGTSPYTYLWSDTQIGATATGFPAGTYEVYVTDDNGCMDTASITITEPTLLVAAAAVDSNASCNGFADGGATASASGGTAPYTYLWSDNQVTQSATGLGAGTYIVTVTDANGCEDTASVVITEPALLVASTVLDSNASCNGFTDGGATASANGGTSPYTYLWSDNQVTESAVGLGAGTYTVTVTDANGCTDTSSVTITEPMVLVASTMVDSNASCNTFSDGGATAQATGGTAPYTYLWSDNQVAQSAVGLAAGTYTVTITDDNGCQDVATVTITEPTPLVASTSLDSNVSCNALTDGGATASASGATGPYTYLWSDNQVTESAVALGAGPYTVTVTDANGCQDVSTIVITEPALLVVSTVVDSNVSCYGLADGGATASSTGGTTPYSYMWPNSSTNPSIDGLAAGSYVVTVTDFNGCTDTATVVITEPDSLTITTSVNDISCFGFQDGTIALTVTGGTQSYNYNWSTGSTQDSISLLDVGTYTVTVSDANGCSKMESYSITQPSVLAASIFSTSNVLCNGDSTGTIVASAAGGTAGYSFSWPTPIVSINDTALNVPAGTYTVTVTDANGCTDTEVATITEPTPIVLSVTSTTMVTCVGGSDGEIQVNATGGAGSFTYSWNNSTVGPVNSNLSAAEYCVTVTDANGCQDSVCVIITELNALPTVHIGNDTIFCQQDFTLSAGSFSSYLWDDGSTNSTLMVNSSGTYSVTVTDANGCQNADTTVITMLTLPDPNVTIIDSADCGISNGVALAGFTNPGGGAPYTYLWSNGQNGGPGITGIGFGNYTLTVTDANGCVGTEDFQMLEDTVILATISASDVTCFGAMDGSVAVTALNGTSPYSYNWSNSSVNDSQSSIGPGVYSVTLTDANGCQAIADTVVTEPLEILLSTSSVETTCGASNGNATVVAGPGSYNFTYAWNDAGSQTTPTAFNLGAGIYTVTVTNQFNCSETATISVNDLGAPVLTTGFSNEQCPGAADGFAYVDAVGNGMLTYTWDDPSNQTTDTANNLSAGIYGVTVTDTNGCSSFASIPLITEFQNPVISLGNDTTVCELAYSLSPGPGFSAYEWSNSGVTDSITVTASNTYTVTVTDSNGCQASDAIDLTMNDPVVFNEAVTDANCNQTNGAIALTISSGTGPFAFNWSTGGTNNQIDNVGAGFYGVTVSDINGCSASDSIEIGLVDAPQITLTSDSASCAGVSDGSAAATVTGGAAPYTYLWSNGAVTDSLNAVMATTYTVTVTDDSNCVVTASIAVEEPAKIILDVTTIASTCGVGDGEATVSASGGAGGFTYQWNDPANQTTPTASNLAAGLYVIVVTDAEGCFNSENVALNDNGAPLLLTDGLDASCSNSPDGTAWVEALGGAPFSYLWNDPLNQTNDTASNLLPGSYAVSVTDTANCLGVGLIDIDFLDEAPNVSLGPDVTVCEGAEVILTPGGGFSSYTWNTGETATDINVTASGTYSVSVTSANGCGNLDSVEVQIIPTPVVDLGSDTLVCSTTDISPILTLNAGSGFASYAWSTGETTQSIDVDQTNFYSVTVTTAEGCVGNDAMIAVFDTCINLNADELAGNLFELNLYPNPTLGRFWIEMSGFENGKYEVVVSNLQGQPVWSRSISIDGNREYREEVSLENIAAGMYVLRLMGNDKQVERRVIVQ